jgi:2-haloacid dehalogenase
LWKKIERGETTLATLQISRFVRLFAYMQIKWEKCDPGGLYLKQLERYVFLLDDADIVCGELHKTCALYIVTNGIAPVQRGRLARSGLMPYMSGLFVSEDIGFPKPHRYFFDSVFTQLGPDTARSKILIIGDSLSADIAGGRAAGIDTCWYNPRRESNKGSLRPTYEIASLAELLDICL